jgi:hypothetical protein
VPTTKGQIIMTNKYNGWTNYATWRVHLEIFDGLSPYDFNKGDAYDLGQDLKAYAHDLIEADTKENTIAQSYALAFLDDVNWREIAQAMKDAYDDCDETDDCDDETSEAA